MQLKSIKDDSTYFDIYLEKIPAEVSSVWFVANIYRKTFEDVQNLSCHIRSHSSSTFAYYELNFGKDVDKFNGNIIISVKRSEVASNVWVLKSLGYYT